MKTFRELISEVAGIDIEVPMSTDMKSTRFNKIKTLVQSVDKKAKLSISKNSSGAVITVRTSQKQNVLVSLKDTTYKIL